uniref:WD_REPEATS_REGION domain-containing protein n=1 Tax=Thelazia callipaeda TaxID=103827 RepID=A0A0N5DAU5_THECL
LIAIQAHKGDIDDLDVSPNGKLCISVGHDCGVHIWNTLTGEKLRTLSIPEKIDDGFRVRSVRFTSLGSINTIFLATYNQIRLSKKAVSYAALWAFNHERSICRPILTISTLSVSDCGKFFAIGTMDGSVGIYDTHDLKPLYFSHKTHNIFVTGIDFLPRKTFDFGPLFGDNSRQRCIYPGIASEYRAAIISLSADQTVQFHSVPYSKPNSLTDFLLKLSFITLLLYYIIWEIWIFFVGDGLVA